MALLKAVRQAGWKAVLMDLSMVLDLVGQMVEMMDV